MDDETAYKMDKETEYKMDKDTEYKMDKDTEYIMNTVTEYKIDKLTEYKIYIYIQIFVYLCGLYSMGLQFELHKEVFLKGNNIDMSLIDLYTQKYKYLSSKSLLKCPFSCNLCWKSDKL